MNGSVYSGSPGGTYPNIQFSSQSFQTGSIFTGSSYQLCAVFPFKLPYIPPGETITSATLSFNLAGTQGPPSFHIDCYGLNRQSATASDILQGDYYAGSNDASNTLLEANFFTPSTTIGSTVMLSNAALVSWLQSQYTTAGNNGLESVWAFVRLSPQSTPPTGGNWNYEVASSNSVNRSLVPTLSITTSGTPTASAGSLIFTFNLASSAYTSAGVFDGTGKLRRTIWSNVPCNSGYNVGAWDGKDDGGNTLSGSYTIKVLHHNISYVWEGILGNTSASQTGVNVWRSLNPLQGMCLGGSKMFFANGYSEQIAQLGYFAVGSPQVPTQFFPSGNATDYTNAFGPCASDGTTVYFSNQSGSTSGAAFIMGVTISTGNLVSFSSGSSQGVWSSVIHTVNGSSVATCASSIAVDSNFIYACLPANGEIAVYNKTTGAFVNFITKFTTPVSISVDPTGYLLVLDSSTGTLNYVQINTSNGTVIAHNTVITGLGTGVLYHDSDHTGGLNCAIALNTNQVAIYNRATAGTTAFSLVTTLGTSGGQPTVGQTLSNTNFWLGTSPWIAFQSASDFWVSDTLNQRYQHYTISGGTATYVESIIYRNTSYCTDVELSQGIRLFSGFYEYAINYSNLPGGLNGSWSMVANWAATLPSDASHNYQPAVNNAGLSSICTMSNGRTYAFAFNSLGNSGAGSSDLLELTSTGVRVTNFSWPGGSGSTPVPRLYPDGTLRYQTYSGGVNTFYKKTITGFDGSNNPIFGSAVTLATATSSGTDTNLNQFNNIFYSPRIEPTSGGIYPVYRGDGGKGYHLGGIAAGGTAWQWETLTACALSGRLWIPTNATTGNTVTINGTAYTGVASGATGAQFNVGASASATITNIATAVAAHDTNISTIYDSSSVTFTVTTSASSVSASTNITGAYWNQNICSGDLSYGGGASRSGMFDIGNAANYFGNLANVCGNTIICGYQGENWKGSEADLWYHIHESGLYLGTFGTPTIYTGGNTPGSVVAGQGGNSFYSTVILNNGNYYLYYNDEAGLGGVGRFRIANLSSIGTASGTGSTGSIVALS